MVGDIQRAAGDGKCAVLIALDISAAFNAVDHSVLGARVNTDFAIGGTGEVLSDPRYLHEQLRDHQVARALRSYTTASLFCLRLLDVLLLCTSSLELFRDIHKMGEHFQ